MLGTDTLVVISPVARVNLECLATDDGSRAVSHERNIKYARIGGRFSWPGSAGAGRLYFGVITLWIV